MKNRSDAVIAAMTEHLVDYLFDEDLYVNVEVSGSGPSLVKMTLGSYLASIEKKRVLEKTGDVPEDSLIRQANRAIQSAIEVHSRHWDSKISREATALLKSWRWYVENLENDREAAAENYEAQVGVRLQLARLLELSPLFSDRQRYESDLSPLDEMVLSKWAPLPEPVVNDGLVTKKERHPWLYGTPTT